VPETQLTLVQIDNYGPWTVTPSPRREMDLQTMQSRLYADLSQFVGHRGGYVFFTRFDNMVAVTNGLDRAAHERLQETVRNRYPVTVSLAVAADPAPATAMAEASGLLQDAGSAQDDTRREVLRGTPAPSGDQVTLAHFDVNDATGRYTDELNAFDSFIRIEQGYATLMRYMREEHEALSFFVGGDNIIAVCPALSTAAYEDAIGHVEAEADVSLKVGVGRGDTAESAGMDAKEALERCRETGARVEGAPPAASPE
jgi:GTP cyclohydrolase IIa